MEGMKTLKGAQLETLVMDAASAGRCLLERGVPPSLLPPGLLAAAARQHPPPARSTVHLHILPASWAPLPAMRLAARKAAGLPSSLRALLLILLAVHACWCAAWAYNLHAAEATGLGIPLPGFQSHAILGDPSESEPVEPEAGVWSLLNAAAVPVRQCPLEVDWSRLPTDPNKGRAAVWTPYHLTLGGGERYLLSVVAVLQELGYLVDVLVLEDNVCKSKDFLLRTAEGLRLRLDEARLELRVVGRQGARLQMEQNEYSIFFCLGNEKTPHVHGIGLVSLFMNQFPFDGYDTPDEAGLEALSTYDYVLLNSRFSYRWWLTYMARFYYPALEQYGSMPLVEVLHPPVDVFSPTPLDDLTAARQAHQHSQAAAAQPAAESTQGQRRGAHFSGDAKSLLASFRSMLSKLSHRGSAPSVQADAAPAAAGQLGGQQQPQQRLRGRALGGVGGAALPAVQRGPPQQGEAAARRHIVLVGRFFEGRQSKGHGTAVAMFRNIHQHLPPGTELHLVGNLVTGVQHSSYLFNVMQSAVGLPVKFHVGVSSKDVEAVLHTALVQWHLTGVELKVGEDPASEEHFGISVAEGMSAGCIPVVLRRGGVEDIVSHGANGFLGADPTDLEQLTLGSFNMSADEAAAMRTQAIRDVQRFSHPAFAHRFKAIAQRAALSKPFRHLVQDTLDVVASRQFRLHTDAQHLAIIVAPERHYAFEYVVKSVLYHLTSNRQQRWGLLVLHSLGNSAYVQRALKGIANVQLRAEADPAALLTSPQLWEGVTASRVLLFSVDSLLLRPNLGEFLQYQYVSAPNCPEAVSTPLPTSELHSEGRGALALVSVAAMRSLTRRLANGTASWEGAFAEGHPLPTERLIDKLVRLSVDTPSDAASYRFAVEAPCPQLEQGFRPTYGHPLHTLPHVPLGLQATWYHFSSDPQRYSDLLRLLSLSVCGYQGGPEDDLAED